jgi:hypothetical protein
MDVRTVCLAVRFKVRAQTCNNFTCLEAKFEGASEQTTEESPASREMHWNRMEKQPKNVNLTKHHVVKTYGGVEVWLHVLTSALDGGEWLASRPGSFTPVTHWIGGSVGPRAVLNAVAKGKILVPPGNRTPIVQPVA